MLHARTDGSSRRSAGLGWVTTGDDDGAGDVLALGSEPPSTRQTAFDAQVAAIQ
jgi:hypothetical protein